MSVVVSFTGFIPAARFDGLSWTEARIEEAQTAAGTWAQIDAVALTPDTDPAHPEPRDFTTELGTAENLWYRIVFADASGDVTEPTTPIQNAVQQTQGGLCDNWVTADDVALCCDITIGSDVQEALDDAAEVASYLMFQLSGRQFPGQCLRTVRPCNGGCTCWPPAVYGYFGWHGRCQNLSRVLLAGYPVQAITEVLLDGVALDPSEYRLDGHRYLTRMADTDGNRQTWPGCQRLDLPSTEENTFAVSYVYGQDPPLLGVQAATVLACELYRACPGSAAGGDCQLPSGVTQIVRQGLTMTVAPQLASILRSGATGLVAVDSFLAAANPGRLTRASAVWSPDVLPYAQPEGV